MSNPSTVWFSKMHGAGNDFVILDLRDRPPPSARLCKALADRHTGVGCDLILGVEPPRSERAVASYRIWTADGSPSSQCGNGARCVAAWVLRAGMASDPEFALDSPTGTHAVEALSAQCFRVAMGTPRFAPEHIPLQGFASEQQFYEADLGGNMHIRFAAVSMGNPHAVIAVDDVRRAPVAAVGMALQASPYFPRSVNVGFTEIVSRDRINLRVFEYGAGETLACGSGACAAAAVLIRHGHIGRNCLVSLPGGELHIAWPRDDATVLMTGPATFVFEGQFFHHEADHGHVPPRDIEYPRLSPSTREAVL